MRSQISIVSGLLRGAILSVGLGLPLAAGAQVVTLAEAQRQMLDGDPQLDILDLEEDVAAEAVRQARGQRFPRVSLSLDYVETRQEIVNQDNTTFQEGTSSYPTKTIGLSVTQPIYDPVMWRSMSVAQAEQALVAAQSEVARNQLDQQLVDAFLGVARTQVQVDQANQLVQARTRLERTLELQVEGGTIDADAFLRAQSDTFAARADQADREMDLSEALFELRRFTGPGVTGVSYGAGAIVGVDRFLDTFSRGRLAEMSPRLQVARAEIDVAERQLHQTRAAMHPTADLTLQYENEETEGSLFGGGSNVQSSEIGLSVDWSIYEGGVRRSRNREAQARVEIAERRLALVQDQIGRRYDALVGALRSATQSLQAVSAESTSARRRYAAALEQQEAGRVSTGTILEAELRRDTAALQARIARLRIVELEARILGLFGALDMQTLSKEFQGA